MNSGSLKVLLHYRSSEVWDWKQEQRQFKILPRVGEYVALQQAENWYRIELVLHGGDAGVDAVLYAIDAGMSFDQMVDREAEPALN